MMQCGVVVLAAGKGTRMYSFRPKVLQTLLEEPMLGYVLRALHPLFEKKIWVVVGHGADDVKAAFPRSTAHFVLQEEQLGTGHALLQALPQLKEALCSHVLVVNGDTPLLHTAFIEHFMAQAADSDIAFATLTLENPANYGRVVRQAGNVQGIVEAKDYDAAVHGEPTGEVNAGVYLLRRELAEELLPQISNANKSGEYYLTDIVSLAVSQGRRVMGVSCGSDPALFGVNTPQELCAMEEQLRAEITRKHLENGVIIHADTLVRIGPRVKLAQGAEIFGPCELYGETMLSRWSRVESHCVLRDSVVMEKTEVRSFSYLDGAVVGQHSVIGPFARLRPGTLLEENCRVGNFVETKKVRMGKGAKAGHLSYLGDALVGARTNIGAGTITCNYNGQEKNTTIIGDDAFIGSNTALVAPVKVGNSALVGAGSVITTEVPEGQLALTRAQQVNSPRKKR